MLNRTTVDCMQVVAAGGGITLDASKRTTIELMQIAAAASRTGAAVILTGSEFKPTTDLLQIASAGKGCVSFS